MQTTFFKASRISAKSRHQLLLLYQLARMRAALFRYDPPRDFVAEYLLERLFKFMPDSLSIPVTPTREFWMHVLESKIKATIRSESEIIGWESDEETVGPVALGPSSLSYVPSRTCCHRILPMHLSTGSFSNTATSAFTTLPSRSRRAASLS